LNAKQAGGRLAGDTSCGGCPTAELAARSPPKAVAKITEDLDVLLAFYDYPAEHRVHLRTTNPIAPSPP
jgi:hypothetical protein